MTTFHLRQRIDGSMFITEDPLAGVEPDEGVLSVEADCWLAAKDKMGFPLTPMQQAMLGLRAAA
jgi:hypothetical protein